MNFTTLGAVNFTRLIDYLPYRDGSEDWFQFMTYSHLILAAVFPIYIGAHASLRRPSSAAKPKSKSSDEDKAEGLKPSDAIMIPVVAGITLAGLYFLINWLKDPAILNRILGWYFSTIGVFGVGKLATDFLNVGTSFIFPSVWSSRTGTYHIDPSTSQQIISPLQETSSKKSSTSRQITDETQVHRGNVSEITNPLPGTLSSRKFSESITKNLWSLRGLLKNHWILRSHVRNAFSFESKVQIQDTIGLIFGMVAVTLYNTLGRFWLLSNLIAFGLCYGTLPLMSPTTFWTGSLVLAGLFIYDITMVFYTPLMVTVATALDVPIKLTFPAGTGKGSMLGLGDVILPGIMIGLALRFDLYLHYLRKQTPSPSKTQSSAVKTQTSTVEKATYVEATGNWGERFWTGGVGETVADASRFKKTYFNAGLVGYVIGMVITLLVLRVFNHAQPALLYLVPGVLIALWGTAAFRGELSLMWAYTEDEVDEDEASEERTDDLDEKTAETDAHSLSSFSTDSDDERGKENGATKTWVQDESIVFFSLSAPKQQLGVPKKAKLFKES